MTGWSPGSGEGDAGREGTRFSATALLTLGLAVLCVVRTANGIPGPASPRPATKNVSRHCPTSPGR